MNNFSVLSILVSGGYRGRNHQDERWSRKYATKETIAPPKHMPVPMRRTTSTPRIFTQAGLLSMAKRFMTPKKVSTKKIRGTLRRLFIDCSFNG